MKAIIFIWIGFWASVGFGGESTDELCIPRNDMRIPIPLGPPPAGGSHPGVTEAEFISIALEGIDRYKSFAAVYGAKLQAELDWESETVNAFARQEGNVWTIRMFGGLARHPFITADSYTAVVCHELGHHFGGYPHYSHPLFPWAAAEGQADYYATETCLEEFWATEFKENFLFSISENVGQHHYALSRCEHRFQDPLDIGLCTRISIAGKELADLLWDIGHHQARPQFHTPSDHVAPQTFHQHPPAQCRLDTYVAGALCNVPSSRNQNYIPGKTNTPEQGGINGRLAETQSIGFGCSRHVAPHNPNLDEDFGSWGPRPRCWFRPQLGTPKKTQPTQPFVPPPVLHTDRGEGSGGGNSSGGGDRN